jgi:hypothetical protein
MKTNPESTANGAASLSERSGVSPREFQDSNPVSAPYLALGSGTIYLFWKTTPNGTPIKYRASTNQGTNFGSAQATTIAIIHWADSRIRTSGRLQMDVRFKRIPW